MSRYATDRYATAAARPNAKCWVCERKTVEWYVDPETGSITHDSTCSPACWNASALKPYCHTPECSGQVCGTITVLVNGRDIPNGAEGIYECSRGCGKRGTKAEWSHAANFASGYRDKTVAMQGIDPWLVETRLRHATGDQLVSYQAGVDAAIEYSLGGRFAYDVNDPVLRVS